MNQQKIETIVEQAAKVNWKSIKDRNGFIEYDISNLLRNLISSDKEKREKSYWGLDNNIVIQSGLSESCLFILPFLNELVKIAENKDRLLDLIFEIINGSDLLLNGFVKVQCKEIKEPFMHYQLSKDIEPIQLKPLITKFIEQNTNLYCELLSTKNKKELETILYILLCFSPSEYVRKSFYEAKNNQIEDSLIVIFNGFIEDIEEIHGVEADD